MSKVKIAFTQNFELTFDKNSPAFKEALEDYKAVIDSDGDAGGMLQHVAYSIGKKGLDY